MVILLIICTFGVNLLCSRDLAGYDSRYNNRSYFTVKNRTMARILLSSSLGFRISVKRAIDEFNKMTYLGAFFYICNIVLLLFMLIFLFVVPEIPIQPYELGRRYFHICIDSLNEKLPILLAEQLFSVEAIYIAANSIAMAREGKKATAVLMSICRLLVILFGLLNIYELVSTFANL